MSDEITALAAWLANADGFALYRPQAERMLAAKKMPHVHRNMAWTAAALARAQEMWIAGTPTAVIASEFGCSAHAIRTQAAQRGWGRRKKVTAPVLAALDVARAFRNGGAQ
jgi:hypothetical protein